MDLNGLYHRHQVSLDMSEHAAGESSRAAHLALAEGYASEIVGAKPFPAADPADPALVMAFRNVEIVA